jgi:hypothetical protein
MAAVSLFYAPHVTHLWKLRLSSVCIIDRYCPLVHPIVFKSARILVVIVEEMQVVFGAVSCSSYTTQPERFRAPLAVHIRVIRLIYL